MLSALTLDVYIGINILQSTPNSRSTGVAILAILNILGRDMLIADLLFVAMGTIFPALLPSAAFEQQQGLTGAPEKCRADNYALSSLFI